MGVRVRFAPSPTGRLHVGNVRVALINFLFARRRGGQFILRLDDTDRERSTADFAAAIEADLRWLGLDWDRKFSQSERLAQYEAAASKLKDAGRLYPCYETAQELEFRRKRAMAQGKPPVYDRAALRLSDADRARLEGEGRRPHWRFKLDAIKTAWIDLVRGAQQVDEASQSDPVLVRADGTFLYTLTSVVDDIDVGITQVIRGEDHVTNTGTQIQIFQALGARPPEFAHLPLLTDATGAGLSKRLGSLSIGDLRAQGYEPLALAALLAHLGTADAIEAVHSLQPLIDGFAFEKFARGTPKFSLDELAALNAKVLHQMPYELAAVRGREMGITVDEKLWLAVRPNLQFLGELGYWREVCQGEIAPAAVDREFAAAALGALPDAPWGEQTWKQWSQGVAKATGKKGRELFQPLRLALTGREHGPEMHNLLPLIGRERAQARLRALVEL